MVRASLAFACSTAASAALTPGVRLLAHRLGFLDHALTSRKVHGQPVPRLGGVAIIVGFYAPLFSLALVSDDVGMRLSSQPRQVAGLLSGGAIIAALGLWDDVKGVRARTKLAVQLGVGVLMYALGYRIEQLANPFGPEIPLGLLSLPFTVLWIAGVINAINLIDGLDGLAGGVALSAIATMFGLAAFHGDPLILLLTGALGGAVLGFLFYNFNPATIFMGDAGSMFLGFVLSVTAIQTNRQGSTAVAIAVPIMALGIPIVDTSLAMMRRAMRGVPLFSADRGHIHHRLLDLGFTHRQAVLVLYGASAFLGTAALAFSLVRGPQATLFLLALTALGYLVLRRLGYLHVRTARVMLNHRRHNLAMRRAVRRAGETMRDAPSLDLVWAATLQVAGALGAEAVALDLPGTLRTWRSYGFDGHQLVRARYSLLPERPGQECIELGWGDGRTSIDRDTEIAIELLCEHLADSVERLEVPTRPRLRVVS